MGPWNIIKNIFKILNEKKDENAFYHEPKWNPPLKNPGYGASFVKFWIRHALELYRI